MIGCQPQTTNSVWLKYFCKQIKNLYANISQDKHQFTAKKGKSKIKSRLVSMLNYRKKKDENILLWKKNTIYVHRVCILNNSTKMSNKEIPGRMSTDVFVGYLPIFQNYVMGPRLVLLQNYFNFTEHNLKTWISGYLPIILSWAGLVSLFPARFLALQLYHPPSDFWTLCITRFPPPE